MVRPFMLQISADHMTMAYKPTPAQCLQLPLGRDAALFVVGAAADYRAQVRTPACQGERAGVARSVAGRLAGCPCPRAHALLLCMLAGCALMLLIWWHDLP